MLCVSIGRGRHRHVIAEHKHLATQGAELVELRLDYINGEVNLKRLLAERHCPVIITCRRKVDGGKWAGAEEARLLLLRTAIAEGVDYVDLEEDVAGSIPRFGKTRRIVSFHDFRRTPDDLEAIHARLAALNADIVKLATLANNPHDNVRMLRLVKGSKAPTIGFCMGDVGTPSRILCGKFGSPFSYATFHHERVLAPGQLSFQHMRDIYNYDEVNRETTVFGVIADPVGHSLSPQVHNAAFRQLGRNCVYVPFRIAAGHLDQFLADAPELGIRGLSVTIPHKETVAKKLTNADPMVQGIGATNTVVFRDGELHGFNTDCQAALDSLEAALDGEGGDRSPVYNKRVVILGAGGAARAIGFGLKQRGADIIIASRTAERAAQLAESLGCRSADWSARHSLSPDVLVNCTPVGMHPNVDETPFERVFLRPSMVVFDTVYNPETTLLVKDARTQNCTVITGVEMFVRQAALQFKLFTGRDAPGDLMREVLKRATGPAKL